MSPTAQEIVPLRSFRVWPTANVRACIGATFRNSLPVGPWGGASQTPVTAPSYDSGIRPPSTLVPCSARKLAKLRRPFPPTAALQGTESGCPSFLGQMPPLRASRYEAAVRRIHGHSDPVDPFNFFSASTRMLRKSSSVANHFSSSRASRPAALRVLMRICPANGDETARHEFTAKLKNRLHLICIGFDKTADDSSGQLLGHAAMTNVVHM